MSNAEEFTFLNPGILEDKSLRLVLTETQKSSESIWLVPAYIFHMRDTASDQKIGSVTLRIGATHRITHLAGNIGYVVDEPYRGHHYAERSCRLLLPLARLHGMRELWLTCGPDNLASRRTLERLGAEFVEIVEAPDDYPMPEGAVRKKLRFRLAI
jgi:tagatose 1,6-diphosphate aldolase